MLEGTVAVAGSVGDARLPEVPVVPGELAYLGSGRDELEISAREDARLMLIGGAPFQTPILMWWNFVARSRAEIDAAFADWQGQDARFGRVASSLPRIPGAPPFWPGRPR